MEDGYPRLTDEVAEKLNAGDTDYLINTIGAGFGGSGNYFFEFVLTNKTTKITLASPVRAHLPETLLSQEAYRSQKVIR